jgi:phosphatidylglycerol:prolipoprotein diacylglycerol transferase
MLASIPFPSWIRPEIIPGLPIRWYGLMYLVAFVVAYLMFMLQAKQRGLDVKRDQVLDMFFWAIIGLLVGARAAAVTIYDPTGYYLHHPLQIILPFAVVDGRLRLTGISGMSYHGGLVGTIIAIVVYLKVKRLDVLEWGDLLVTGIPLGYTFGRLGNFINGELYGRVTSAPWGMIFPDAEKFNAKLPWVKEYAARLGMSIPASGLVNLPRHPSQLYEGLFEGFVLWLVMWFILRPRRPFKGFQIACYIMGYGIIRFIIEYVREPDIGIGWPITLVPLEHPEVQFSPFNFSTGQILCFLMVAAGVVCLFVFRSRARSEAARAAAAAAPKPSSRRLRKKAK